MTVWSCHAAVRTLSERSPAISIRSSSSELFLLSLSLLLSFLAFYFVHPSLISRLPSPLSPTDRRGAVDATMTVKKLEAPVRASPWSARGGGQSTDAASFPDGYLSFFSYFFLSPYSSLLFHLFSHRYSVCSTRVIFS